MSPVSSFVFYWVPFLLYCALILSLSSQSQLPDTARISDKLLHGIEYLIFGFLLLRALTRNRLAQSSRKRLAITLLTGAAFSAFDEYYQSYIPGRFSSVYDWYADVAGIILMITLLLVRRYRDERTTFMKPLRFFLFITLFLSIVPSLHAIDIMPLSEVKEGMTGVGRTVFKGDKIEEFEVEILGILKNYLPQQNLILGMLKGGNLEETGVIAGMSGSPVFINGKMIGAVAYSWPFAKTPIAGITPIESMLQTQVMPMEQTPLPPPVEVSEFYNFESLFTNHFRASPPVQTNLPGMGKLQLMPISAPLSVSGFDQRVIDRFTPILSKFGLQPMQGAAMVQGEQKEIAPNSLEPGSPVSVQLITGDFDIGAIGTVTYRDAEKVLAFGHPFYNLGPINFPMATAKIYTVVPSLFSSFKLGASGSIVGSVRQDLQQAIFGIVGSKTQMIPVSVRMKNGKEKPRVFNFEVVNHKLFTPILIDFAFQNSIMVTQVGYSESTLKVSGLIHVKGQNPIAVNNIFSGVGSFTNASQYVASVLFALMTNEFKDVEIQDVVIDVDSTMQRREAEILEVWVDKNEVRPGDEVNLKAMYRPQLGEPRIEEFTARIPQDVQTNQIYFVVGGGQEISRQEYALYGKAYRPDSLDQIIALLNSLRSNDRIYLKAFTNEPSLIMKGQVLYSLPTSVLSILSSSQTIGSSQRVNRLALWEDSRPTDYYLTGTKIFSVKVLPKQN